MTCLDDEIVLGLVEGRLPPRELEGIEAHLDGCASCRDVVALVARARSPSRVLAAGDQLGRYVIGELVGAGAMGRVYAARQPELDRNVAIKVLSEEAAGAGADARARLLAEAQAMARLGHPNVVGVHEVGTTDDAVYVVMELVDGEPLRAWMAGRPWREVAARLAEIARGLAAVHRAGVVHRDIKPDNIIVARDGAARLGDFGLARASHADGEQAPRDGALALGTLPPGATTHGTAIAGTPAYMAPEVLRGGSATAASDQFSFGVTAYEALSGRRPFAGATWAALLQSIERGELAPLADVPRWLDAAVRRCLAIDPARRFPAMADVAALVDQRLMRRSRGPWVAAALATAALASAATWYAARDRGAPGAGPSCDVAGAEIAASWSASSPLRARLGEPVARGVDAWTAAWRAERTATCRAARAQPASQIAAREQCLDRRRRELDALLERARVASAERLADALAAISPAECAAATPSTAEPIPLDPDRARAVHEIARALPAVRAQIALGDARPAVASLDPLAARASGSGHAPTIAAVQLLRAEALRADSQLAPAARAARDALAAAQRGRDDRLAAEAWLVRVQIAGDQRELALAEELAAIADGAIDRAGAPPRLVALLARTRGLLAYARGDHAAVRALLGEARAQLSAISGARSLDVAGIETALGIAARTEGDLDAAERHHRAALAIDRELRGDRHPDIARDLHNLAGIARLRGDLDGALASYEQALAIEVALRGEGSVQAGLTHNSLGLVKLARRDLAGARAELALALATLTAAGHGDRAFPEHNLGIVAAASGDHRTAIAHFTRAEATYRATIGETTPGPIRLLLDRARSEAALGRVASARSYAERARAAAARADIAWIADEARALLRRPRPRPPALHVAVEPPAEPQPTPPPAPAAETEVPPPPPPAQPSPPPPRAAKDVGVYGSSGGW